MLTMRLPGNILVSFKLFVARQRVRLELLASPVRRTLLRTVHLTRRGLQPADGRWLLGKVVVRHGVRLLPTLVLAKKGGYSQDMSLNLPICTLLM